MCACSTSSLLGDGEAKYFPSILPRPSFAMWMVWSKLIVTSVELSSDMRGIKSRRNWGRWPKSRHIDCFCCLLICMIPTDVSHKCKWCLSVWQSCENTTYFVLMCVPLTPSCPVPFSAKVMVSFDPRAAQMVVSSSGPVSLHLPASPWVVYTFAACLLKFSVRAHAPVIQRPKNVQLISLTCASGLGPSYVAS